MKKVGSELASRDVTEYCVRAFYPKESEHQKTTLASGDAPRTGHLFETTNPLLRVATGVFLLHIHFHILDVLHTLMKRALDLSVIAPNFGDFFVSL